MIGAGDADRVSLVRLTSVMDRGVEMIKHGCGNKKGQLEPPGSWMPSRIGAIPEEIHLCWDFFTPKQTE